MMQYLEKMTIVSARMRVCVCVAVCVCVRACVCVCVCVCVETTGGFYVREEGKLSL